MKVVIKSIQERTLIKKITTEILTLKAMEVTIKMVKVHITIIVAMVVFMADQTQVGTHQTTTDRHHSTAVLGAVTARTSTNQTMVQISQRVNPHQEGSMDHLEVVREMMALVQGVIITLILATVPTLSKDRTITAAEEAAIITRTETSTAVLIPDQAVMAEVKDSTEATTEVVVADSEMEKEEAVAWAEVT